MSLRWGIIGCGAVCEQKSGPPLYQLPGSELSVVMRRDPEKAADFARRHGIRRHESDAQAVIDAPDVDIVYVATPPGSHLEYALRVAEAGKPCYVEKPMARSAAECRQMLEAFEQRRLPLFVAYYRRALPRFMKLKQVLDSGALGQLLFVNHDYQKRSKHHDPNFHPPSGPEWRLQAEHSGGGLFLDLASHALDLMDFLLGPLETVRGIAESGSACPVEDRVVLSFRCGQVLGAASYVFDSSVHADRLQIVGSAGRISGSVFGTEPFEISVDGRTESLEAPTPTSVQEPLIRTIIDELSGAGPRCPSRAESALRTSLVIDQVLSDYYGGREDEFWLRPESWPGSAPTLGRRS